MSVYTTIDHAELEVFLGEYSCGSLTSFEGISAGIENTNYFVTTSQGEYVLTLFESLRYNELPYFLDLMAYLSEHGVPSAHPVADKSGAYLRTLKDKPAALVKRLHGACIEQPTANHCLAVGKALVHMHNAAKGFKGQRRNERGPHWWKEMVSKLETRLEDEDINLLRHEIAYQSHYRFVDLPRGVIHADLFRDNVLFSDSTLTGIIDFYYACTDVLLYDVAVAANDWCSVEDGSVDESLLRNFLHAYLQQRKVTNIESAAWPVMLRAAALRFWLSRLHDLHFPREGEITHTKDPDAFKNILLHRTRNEEKMRLLWADCHH